jgi:hypothetical protein
LKLKFRLYQYLFGKYIFQDFPLAVAIITNNN